MTTVPSSSRFRLSFGKLGPMRWTGHLALRQSWERTFRRARLPLAYSAGHHPQPKLLFAAPLPLGFTGACELVDVWLEEEMDDATLRKRLSDACPPGLCVEALRRLAPGEPPVSKLVVASVYEAELPSDSDRDALTDAVGRLLASRELPRTRRGRPYDLRPMVQRLSFDQHQFRIEMQLTCLPSQTGRPDEVLDQLGLDPACCRIHRHKQLLQPAEATIVSN